MNGRQMNIGGLGKRFGKLGAQNATTSGGASSNVILLADGTSKLLQTDGTSKVTKAQ